MTRAPKITSQIWPVASQIWPDFAKSGICAKSEIWLSAFDFNGLSGQIQIWLDVLPNLQPNLDLHNEFSSFCQISDLALSTPKGVGELPPQGGEVHQPPLGKFLGPKSQPEEQSDDGGRYRQASTAVVFHPSSPPEEETTHG